MLAVAKRPGYDQAMTLLKRLQDSCQSTGALHEASFYKMPNFFCIDGKESKLTRCETNEAHFTQSNFAYGQTKWYQMVVYQN